ncbi:MAG: tetratricopeptide repeat protein [Candidatus Eremiobacteraeota bacterium]|nr:tetratricopeptide repeat protein [Candidatus Eremiobacteraeota bacterium]
MNARPPRGLPARIYVPIVALIAIVFLGIMAYLVADGFGVTGSVFGKAAGPAKASAMQQQGSQANVEGGPPAAVVAQLKTLRERIAKNPKDDVAITQLGDMELAANRFAEAIPLYRQALKVNPHNVAASTGLAQAREGLRESGGQ